MSFLLWLGGWALAVSFVLWHANSVERYLDRVTATRFTNAPLDTPLRRIPQAISADGQMWVRHSLAMAESGAWRLRSSEIDNAPEGRPIYWNSAWALWLSACGRMRMAFTHESLPTAIETASLWANVPLFLAVLTLASGWIWIRWGGAAGALAALALAGHRKFYEGFYPGYCDHHGLISASVLGVVLGALLGGAGWWRKGAGPGFSPLPQSEAEVMRAVTISAICGAMGLWVSAASLVVTIAFTGIAVLMASSCFIQGGDEVMVCVPRAWRRWGRVGAVLSLGFYLLENFPDRLGMRMEANHPLYSLAWWGAGEVIAAVLAWRFEKRSWKWLAPRLVGWGAVVMIAPGVVWLRGTKVFVPMDPFLGRIHKSIHEFEPLWTAISRAGWRPYVDQLFLSSLILVLLVVWLMSKPPQSQRVVGVLIGSMAIAATALGWLQNRWLLTASGAQIVLSLFLSLALMTRLRSGWRVAGIIVIGGLMYAPGPWTLISERLLVERVRDVQLGETVQLIYRDIAGVLLKAGADARSIVLANPNASVGVGYYGRLRTVGTLYWENRDGLRTAAEIFRARDGAEAAAHIHMRGITHVVMISPYDFLSEYRQALRASQLSTNPGSGFGDQLLNQHRIPVWLRPLEYQVPPPLVPLGFKVALFAVDFDTPMSVAHERIGLHQVAMGALGLAEESFMAASATDSTRSEPWILQGGLMLSRGRLTEAFNFIRAGILRAPKTERLRLIDTASNLFARRGAEGRVYAQQLLEMREIDRAAQ
jgi:hypothetical protein